MTDPIPRSKPAPAPEVPDALLAQWRRIIFAGREYVSNHELERAFAEQAAAWAWAQREDEVRQAKAAGFEEALSILNEMGEGFVADRVIKWRSSETPEPLWRVMTAAYAKATDSNIVDHRTAAMGTAAEIRALADRHLPEEPRPKVRQSPQFYEHDYEAYLFWVERQRLRSQLLSEAALAEADS